MIVNVIDAIKHDKEYAKKEGKRSEKRKKKKRIMKLLNLY